MTVVAILGIGIPGAGKTTQLKPLADSVNRAVYINPDNVLTEIGGDPKNDIDRAKAWEIVYNRVGAALRNGYHVVVDSTNANKEKRCEMICICRKAGAKHIIGMWFQTPLEVCLEQNKADGRRQVDEEIIVRHQCMLDENPPSLLDGFDEIQFIS